MKSTSTKASGLLGDLNFQQPQSSFAEKSVVTSQQNDANHSKMSNFSEQTDTLRQNNRRKETSSHFEAEYSTSRKNDTDDVASRQNTLPAPKDHRKSKGDGRTKRVSVAMSDKERQFITREARKRGLTISEYIYCLASAAACNEIEVEIYLEIE